MKNYIFILLVLFQVSLFGIDCNIKFSITQSTSSQIKVTISHDPNCTVTIEDFNRTIIISSEINKTKPKE